MRTTIQGLAATLLIVLGSTFAASNTAVAQRSPGATITEQFEGKATERRRSRPAAPATPELAVRQRGADAKPLLVLKAVEVTGATAVAGEEIADTYRPYLGKSVSQADLLAIADRITKLYRQKGYTLSRAIVPAQDVKEGRVRVKVIEGYVHDIVLEGDGAERFADRRLLEAVASERPLTLATLERGLLLLSDTPGLRITDTALVEMGETTGRFRLIVQLQVWRLFANVDLDNRGTSDIGPLQAFVATALNSGLVPGDAWWVNVSTIPDSPQELAYLGGMVDLPVGRNGARAGVKGSYSDISPDGARRLVDTRMHTTELGMYATFVPLRTRQASLSVTAFAGLRDADEEDASGVIYDDRIRAVGLTANYELPDHFEGSTYLVLTLRQGLPVLGASQKGDADLSHTGASGEFSKVYWGVTRHQRLGGPWSVLMSTTGQLASSPLLQSEQFSLGGPLFGRAFAAGDVLGDSGVAGLAELRLDKTYEARRLKAYQLYAFLDAGIVWDKGSADHQSLSSYGAGVRLFFEDDFRANFEVALPIDDLTPSSVDRGTRVLFTLSKSFKSCGTLSCGR